MTDKTYKGEVIIAEFKKLEKATAKLAEGTKFLSVVWKVIAEKMDDKWMSVAAGENGKQPTINTAYFFSPKKINDEGKTMVDIAIERFKDEFSFTGSPIEICEKIIGYVNYLICYEQNGYMQIKYVNNSERKPRKVLPKQDDTELRELFNNAKFKEAL